MFRKTFAPILIAALLAATTSTAFASSPSGDISYPVVDTGQGTCYDDRSAIACPAEGEPFYGQDAQYRGNTPSYTGNDDGTVTDNVTGLMWQQSPDTDGDGDIDAADKLTYAEAVAGAETFRLAGYDDWRLPTIKELYSLTDFAGTDPSGPEVTEGLKPFIDTDYFDFGYGDTSAGERIIDSQFASSTEYVSTTMHGQHTMFGVNFADGRIKGYPTGAGPGQSEGKGFYVLYVRGSTDYGMNDFTDNGDGTITDQATGLTWMQTDSGTGMDWEHALSYCEGLEAAGQSDWRLPDVKELQSIVDYTRSPDATGSAAIDPLFSVSQITNEAEEADYPFYWSSTTHANMMGGGNAAYVSFGRSLGYMHDTWMDVHGTGSQRSDPKSGDAGQWPTGHGPQGDAIRIDNHALCVRGGDVAVDPDGDPTAEAQIVTMRSQGMQPLAAGGPGQPGDGGQRPGGPGAMGQACHPDLAVAASVLNVTADQLRQALGRPEEGPPDFEAAAASLGIRSDTLRQALEQAVSGDCAQGGPPPGMGAPPMGDGNGPPPR